jgi:PLP dependent protein
MFIPNMPTAELTRKDTLLANYRDIRNRMDKACQAAGRNPQDLQLLAVTKYAAPADVLLLAETGLLKIAGENKVQDAKNKWVNGPLAAIRRQVELHFIGHLQTNKAKAAVELFDAIDCVDSLKIAAELSRHAAAAGKTVPVMLQLKLNDSPTQSGVLPAEAGALLAEVRRLPGLCARGYLGIAPADGPPEQLKKVFAEARALFDRDFPGRTSAQGFAHHLSLGMSGDFELAVEAGSTLPRVGSSLFA